MQNFPMTLISGASADATAYGAKPMSVRSMTQWSAVATIAGGSTPAGTVSFEVSNDVDAGTAEWAPTNWAPLKDIGGSAVTIAVTDNGTIATQNIFSAFQWIRAKWTHTSGTGGTVTVRAHAIGP